LVNQLTTAALPTRLKKVAQFTAKFRRNFTVKAVTICRKHALVPAADMAQSLAIKISNCHSNVKIPIQLITQTQTRIMNIYSETNETINFIENSFVVL
jgi:hypothetical protein